MNARSNSVAAVYDRRIIDFMPERLRRLDEAFIDLPIYFVTANIHRHQRILSDERCTTASLNLPKKVSRMERG